MGQGHTLTERLFCTFMNLWAPRSSSPIHPSGALQVQRGFSICWCGAWSSSGQELLGTLLPPFGAWEWMRLTVADKLRATCRLSNPWASKCSLLLLSFGLPVPREIMQCLNCKADLIILSHDFLTPALPTPSSFLSFAAQRTNPLELFSQSRQPSAFKDS